MTIIARKCNTFKICINVPTQPTQHSSHWWCVPSFSLLSALSHSPQLRPSPPWSPRPTGYYSLTATCARDPRTFNHFPHLQDLCQSADLATALESGAASHQSSFNLIMKLNLRNVAVTMSPLILNSIFLSPCSSSGFEIPQVTLSRVFF
jgi:hypothetical protein